MAKIVYVKGNIVAYGGTHIAKGFICLAPKEYEQDAVEVIDGDLILYNKDYVKPFYVYAASGDVTAAGGDLGCHYYPDGVYDSYKKELEQIRELIQLEIPSHLRSAYNRQIYISVIGALELFITEMITSLAMGDEFYYNEFHYKSNLKISLTDFEANENALDKVVYKVIHKINAHDLKTIKNIFKNVFNVTDLNIQKLGQYIKTRHDMVHRNGNSVSDHRLQYIDVTNEDIQGLIDVCNQFVRDLMEKLKEPIKHWHDN